jgi:hypothetical protein
MMTPDFDLTRWRKSKHSGDNGGCVELNFTVPGWVGVRDSKLGDASPVLVFTAKNLNAMLAEMKAGKACCAGSPSTTWTTGS